VKGKLPHLSHHEFAQVSGLSEAEVRGLRERFGIDASVLRTQPSRNEQLEQERDEYRAKVKTLEAALAEYRAKVKTLEAALAEVTRSVARRDAQRVRELGDEYTRGFNAGTRHARTANDVEYQRGRAEGLASAGGIAADMIGKLIQLCHPDRHVEALAPLANEVTAKLLVMRKAAKP
jgi:chromosome segregation ATPase